MNPVSSHLNLTQQNSSLSQATQKLESAKRFQDILKAKQNEAAKSPDKAPVKGKVDQKLMEVCHQFESIMVNKMLKVMRQSIHKENSLMHGGQAEEIFDDMLYEKYAMKTSKTANFGLAKQIYDQMSQIK